MSNTKDDGLRKALEGWASEMECPQSSTYEVGGNAIWNRIKRILAAHPEPAGQGEKPSVTIGEMKVCLCARQPESCPLHNEKARAHAELDKAGIPQGALDERVRLVCDVALDRGMRWVCDYCGNTERGEGSRERAQKHHLDGCAKDPHVIARKQAEADLKSCREELAAVTKERDEVTERMQQRNLSLGCIHCGKDFLGLHRVAELTEHITACEKHPMSAVVKERDALRAQLEQAKKGGEPKDRAAEIACALDTIADVFWSRRPM